MACETASRRLSVRHRSGMKAAAGRGGCGRRALFAALLVAVAVLPLV
eukprot:COSAG02_NODE_28579_length_586_cov_33.402464_1_plen_46_part_10